MLPFAFPGLSSWPSPDSNMLLSSPSSIRRRNTAEHSGFLLQPKGLQRAPSFCLFLKTDEQLLPCLCPDKGISLPFGALHCASLMDDKIRQKPSKNKKLHIQNGTEIFLSKQHCKQGDSHWATGNTVCYLYIENAKNLKFAREVECRADPICLMSTKCCHSHVKKNRKSFWAVTVSGTFSESCWPGNRVTQISTASSYPQSIRFGLIYVLTIYVDT